MRDKLLAPGVTKLLGRLGCAPHEVAVVLVDHGSRRPESNEQLRQMVEIFKAYTGLPHVEPAHMELAEPSLAVAYRRCVERGARWILISPFFLLPGQHWTEDIPRLVAEAASRFPHTKYWIAAPLGVDDALAQLLLRRLVEAI